MTLPNLAVRDVIEGPELLRGHGVKAMASVTDAGSKTCEVTFVDRSHGAPRVETEELGVCFHVGSRLPAVYDLRHPSTVRLADSIGVTREYVTDVPIVLLGLVAACAAVAAFRRMRPNRRA